MPFFSRINRQTLAAEDYSPMNDEETEQLYLEDDGREKPEGLYPVDQVLRRTIRNLKILIGFLVGVIFLWTALNVQHFLKRQNREEAWQVDSPVPLIGFEEVVFNENPIYAARPDLQSNRAWDKLLPPGRGYVFVSNWEDYPLQPGEETPYGMIYSVALFHQMHCLGQLRRFTWMFLDAVIKNDTELTAKIKHMFTDLDHSYHLHHCFDYLRQTIACAGDMSLEWPRTEPDGRRFAVDGWGIPHRCKNWVQIMEYMNNNYFNMSGVDQIAPLSGSSGG